MIRTERLKLVPWRADHRIPFAGLHADPEVMRDLGGPISRAESDAKFNRYGAAYVEHGVSRWAVEDADGAFLGTPG